jgi:hypothetical protein
VAVAVDRNCGASSNPRLEQTGARLARHGRAAVGAGQSAVALSGD